MILNRSFSLLLLLLLAISATDLQAQTYMGMHHTAEELAIWRQRVAGITGTDYDADGDVFTNSPGDGTRIENYANEFLATPGESIWPGSLVAGVGYPIYEGVRLQSAAFMYLILRDNNSTKALQYGNGAKAQLLAQVAIPRSLFSNSWSVANTVEEGFFEARWAVRLLFAYDYIKDLCSASEKATLNAWFLSQATFMMNNVNNSPLKECFPNRLTNSYTAVGRDAKPNGETYGIYTGGNYPDGFDYTHRNADGTLGNKISFLSRHWNNRRSDKVNLIGLAGVFLNNAMLINSAKQYSKEWLTYAVYKDGTLAEYDRNGDWGNVQQGMSYGGIMIQQYVFLAEALARKGDTELYNFSTTVGMHGTQGGVKSLKTVMDRYGKMMQGIDPIYYLTVTTANRIDTWSDNNNMEYVWEVLFAIANKFYKNPYYSSLYTRSASGVRKLPASGAAKVSSAGSVWFPWGGTGAETPGILLQHGQMNDLVMPYSTAALCEVPTNLYIVYVNPRSTTLNWTNPRGFVKYNLQYRVVGSSTWTTKSNLIYNNLELADLLPSSTYEWQVQTVGGSCTSTWVTNYFTTPANCSSTGIVRREVWNDPAGTTLTDLNTSISPTFTDDRTSLEGPINVRDNYADRMRAYVCPPMSGDYTFWITGDDMAEIWLSEDGNPNNKRRICWTTTFTASRQWDLKSQQKSATIYLEIGVRCYLEILHRERGGGDNVAAGWTLPNGTNERPIGGNRISTYVPDAPVLVSLSSPQANTTQAKGSTVRLIANATDADGSIIKVEFFESGNLIGEVNRPPFELTLNPDEQGNKVYTAIATNNITKTALSTNVSVNVVDPIVVSPGSCPSGGFLREVWNNVPGSEVSKIPLTIAPSTTEIMNTSLSLPQNIAENYGQRIRAFLCPPTTGSYTFWISGDNYAELWLGTSRNETSKTKIAYIYDYSNPTQYTKLTTQRSAVINLVAGQQYYLEVLHKEGSGGDHVNVQWLTPTGVTQIVPADRLAPYNRIECGTGLLRDYWSNVTGIFVADIPTVTAPTNTSLFVSNFETTTNTGDNYAERFRGYLCAPTTGTYSFWVAGDDHTELWLSTDERVSNKQKIAFLATSATPKQWTKSTTQASVAISLEAGKKYYIEGLHKEATGGDNFSVAWRTPGGTQEVIPLANLASFDPTTAAARIGQDEVQDEATVGGGKLLTNPISAYPNPAKRILNLSNKTGEENTYSIEFIDMAGKSVAKINRLQTASGIAEIDLAGLQLPNGAYLLRVQDDGGNSQSIRFLKAE